MDSDIKEYLDELNLDSDFHEEDYGNKSSEEETHIEWLQEAGLSDLAAPFHEGQEVSLNTVEPFLQGFSSSQKETIKRRVDTLNNTVRQRRSKSKYRKADVRDVFRDISEPRKSITDHDFSMIDGVGEKKKLSRAPSAPPVQIPKSKPVHENVSISHELFRNYVPDVPSTLTDGLKLLRYTFVGTLPRHRSGSDPLLLEDGNIFRLLSPSSSRLSRSHGSLLDLNETYRESSQMDHTDRTRIESLDDRDIDKLKRWFFIEVSDLMDACEGEVLKRKHIKQNKKIESNVFGIPIKQLIEKDEKSRDSSKDEAYQPFVPMVLQKLMKHLKNNFFKEEGLFRVAGLKTRIDTLINIIENHFYTNPRIIDGVLYQVSPHDITSVIKKLLRDIPDPILTSKYLHHFYNAHLLNSESQRKALNLLVLLLPREHQATLKYLVNFFTQLSGFEGHNKMSRQSVATILAPSFFPPRYLNLTKDDVLTQVTQVQNCVRMTETILNLGDTLWLVPSHLLKQLRDDNGKSKNRKVNDKRSSINFNIKVETSQFQQPFWFVAINKNTTARDVVLKVIHEMSKMEDQKIQSKYSGKQLAELINDDIALSCVLSTVDPETCLQTHHLYEYGGNIVKRELEHNVLVSTVLEANPSASWRIECRHRTRHKR